MKNVRFVLNRAFVFPLNAAVCIQGILALRNIGIRHDRMLRQRGGHVGDRSHHPAADPFFLLILRVFRIIKDRIPEPDPFQFRRDIHRDEMNRGSR